MNGNDIVKTTKETIIPLAVAALTVLNIWFASKIAPLAQDVAVLKSRVLANEVAIEALTSRLESKLERLEVKLDDALEYIYSR